MLDCMGEDGEDPGEGPTRLLHADTTRTIIGAFYQLHSDLGFGFLEAVYANGLAVLLREAGLHVSREVTFDIVYHGQLLGRYRADHVVESRVLLEVKTAQRMDPAHFAVLRNYLRASELEVGLLLNFGPRAEFRRIIQTTTTRRARD
ncbi:MAG TPA: GxxExxY protein [Gemmatimonadaceae bacterium]|nr:GxxExxY protein [Gemmatimonadaceae bacterium]